MQPRAVPSIGVPEVAGRQHPHAGHRLHRVGPGPPRRKKNFTTSLARHRLRDWHCKGDGSEKNFTTKGGRTTRFTRQARRGRRLPQKPSPAPQEPDPSNPAPTRPDPIHPAPPRPAPPTGLTREPLPAPSPAQPPPAPVPATRAASSTLAHDASRPSPAAPPSQKK